MMIHRLTVCLLGLALLTAALHTQAAATPGEPAPEFDVADAAGNRHTLRDYRGQWLVLEWFNKDCPFVGKHYGSHNMQSLQNEYTSRDVTWLTVISSHQGKQGYLSPERAMEEFKSHQLAASAPFLLDSSGDMGRAYGAKTTPHMFIINPEGRVVYAGAIDDNDSANPAVIKDSKNYVAAALDEALQGEPVTVASTRPYGCSVKY